MAEQLGLKYGNWAYNTTDTSKDSNGLPTAIDKGTIYVAKTSDGHAQMYVDSPSGERLAIGSAGAGSFFATCNTATNTATKVITCPGLSTPINGTMLTVYFSPAFDSSIENIKLKINGVDFNLNNATYGGKSDLGVLGSFITFIYSASINRFEIMDYEFWNKVSPVTILTGADSVKHYLISTSKSYDEDGTGNGYLGPSGLYVPNTTAPYIDSNGHMTVPAGYLTIGSAGTGRTGIGPQSINWYRSGEYDYSLSMLYEGISLSDDDNGDELLYINREDWYIYTPCDISTDGNIYSNNRITCTDLYTYGGVSSTGSISTAGDLYHKQGVRVPRVWSGTTAPTDDIGENGDIYIMYA